MLLDVFQLPSFPLNLNVCTNSLLKIRVSFHIKFCSTSIHGQSFGLKHRLVPSYHLLLIPHTSSLSQSTHTTYLPTPHTHTTSPNLHLPIPLHPNFTARYVVGTVFGFEHLLLVVAVWLQWVIKPEPKWVRLAIARKEYLAKERARVAAMQSVEEEVSGKGDKEN